MKPGNENQLAGKLLPLLTEHQVDRRFKLLSSVELLSPILGGCSSIRLGPSGDVLSTPNLRQCCCPATFGAHHTGWCVEGTGHQQVQYSIFKPISPKFILDMLKVKRLRWCQQNMRIFCPNNQEL